MKYGISTLHCSLINWVADNSSTTPDFFSLNFYFYSRSFKRLSELNSILEFLQIFWKSGTEKEFGLQLTQFPYEVWKNTFTCQQLNSLKPAQLRYLKAVFFKQRSVPSS